MQLRHYATHACSLGHSCLRVAFPVQKGPFAYPYASFDSFCLWKPLLGSYRLCGNPCVGPSRREPLKRFPSATAVTTSQVKMRGWNIYFVYSTFWQNTCGAYAECVEFLWSIHLFSCRNTHLRSSRNKHSNTCAYIYIHTYICMYIYIYMYIHIQFISSSDTNASVWLLYVSFERVYSSFAWVKEHVTERPQRNGGIAIYICIRIYMYMYTFISTHTCIYTKIHMFQYVFFFISYHHIYAYRQRAPTQSCEGTLNSKVP